MTWTKERASKRERLDDAADLVRGKIVETDQIVTFLEHIIHPGDKVVLEGCNQKQAAFLAKSLAAVSPDKVNHLNMIIPSISRDEHLQLFEEL